MTETPPAAEMVVFKDRRPGLIGFGILVILMGCLSGLLVPMALLSLAVPTPPSSAPPPSLRMIIPAMLLYASASVALIWLGVGSVMIRRWARAVLLILSWAWLLTGVVTLLFMTILLPRLIETTSRDAQLPAAARAVVLVAMFGFVALFFIAVPGSLVLFYRSPHVKATCESRDPVRRWTDKCPLPVLGLSLFLAVGTIWAIVSMVAFKPVLPWFGVLLSGTAARLVWLAWIGLSLYSAWQLYRLRQVGWWLVLITWTLLSISSFVTMRRVNIEEMYRLMGFGDQIETMRLAAPIVDDVLSWMTIVPLVLMLGYLGYLRRFFRQASQ